MKWGTKQLSRCYIARTRVRTKLYWTETSQSLQYHKHLLLVLQWQKQSCVETIEKYTGFSKERLKLAQQQSVIYSGEGRNGTRNTNSAVRSYRKSAPRRVFGNVSVVQLQKGKNTAEWPQNISRHFFEGDWRRLEKQRKRKAIVGVTQETFRHVSVSFTEQPPHFCPFGLLYLDNRRTVTHTSVVSWKLVMKYGVLSTVLGITIEDHGHEETTSKFLHRMYYGILVGLLWLPKKDPVSSNLKSHSWSFNVAVGAWRISVASPLRDPGEGSTDSILGG